MDASLDGSELDLVGDCADDSECPPSGPCTSVRCERGACVIRSVRAGVALPTELQVEGDCSRFVCDGRGQVQTENDDLDAVSDGNPCHEIRCSGGVREVLDVEDGTACNATGTCQGGTCSVCGAGLDCSRPSDCTVHRVTCLDGVFGCEDTGVARAGRACERGKVCHDGSCVPCVVGAECDTGDPCYVGHITSCQDELVCEPAPQSGMACGVDATGRTRFCVAGLCTTPCREGECMTADDPCKTSHWDCSNVAEEPHCAPADRPEGMVCGEASVCHAGACRTNSLVNGDFSRGLEGWEPTGDAASFLVKADEGSDGRLTLSTSPTGAANGAATLGVLAQSFTVADDAVALRFLVSGGQANVRLSDASGATLISCTGVDSNEIRVPVSWDLTQLRGQRLTLSIVDELGSGEWAFVTVSGFDVIRDIEGPLENARWTRGFDAWETTGDGLYFNVFEDHNLFSADNYGRRMSVSTYARAGAANLGDSSRGTVSQSFVVPMDATALRFQLHGGDESLVRLLVGAREVYRRAAADSDYVKVPVSWDLVPYRGQTVRISIEDAQTSPPYGYIGTSGFDLITAYNGP